MRETFGGILLIVGLIIMAGSANDCDGKCMETANTLGEMVMVAFGGLVVSAIGGLILIKNS